MAKKGTEAANKVDAKPQGLQQQEMMNSVISDPRMARSLQGVASGGTSISDYMSSLDDGSQSLSADEEARLGQMEGLQRSAWEQMGKDEGSNNSGVGGILGGLATGTGLGAAAGALMGGGGGQDHRAGSARSRLDALKGEQASLQARKAAAEANAVKMKGAREQLAIDPGTGTKYATSQVQENPLLASLFGKGGLQSRTDTEEQELASRGWSMKPEDYEAYGQASGNIARQSAQEEMNTAKQLAARGLGSSASGAAGAAFSGISGNKNERLAASQRDIADRRMQTNMQRLQQTRQLMQNLGAQAGTEIGNQYNRNLAGVQQNRANLAGTTNQAQAQQNMQQQQANTAFGQEQSTRPAGVGDVLGAVGGGLLGAATGGVGAGLGAGIGKKVGSLFG
jgi:hypothetical protein